MTTRQPMKNDEATVAEAQRIVMAMLGCEADQAGAYLVRRARIEKRSVAETAAAVVAGAPNVADTDLIRRPQRS